MALWKKPSKFKNTAPDPPKREDCIFDLPVGSLSSGNNGVKASSSLLAFHIDGEGGKLGVLPLEAKGRKSRTDLSIICAHSDRIGDFEFSPFCDNLLATCCVRDEPVKLFKLDINHNIPSSCSNADVSIHIADTPAEFLTFHPTANNVLTVAAGHSMFLCDVNKQKTIWSKDFGDKLVCASWNGNGKTLAAINRSQNVCLIDPRSSTPLIGTGSSHAGISRENRVLHLGDSGKFITSGFTKQKNREIILFDERSLDKALTSLQFDASTGILIPLYDCDAKLLFLAGKGSTKIHMLEVMDGSPFFAEGASFTAADVQTLGACLVPKYSLNVMQAEIARLFQLSKNRLSPISYKVPRKTFRDFHSDLYPSTVGHLPGLESDEWFQGENKMPPKFSLDPDQKHLFDQMLSHSHSHSPYDSQVHKELGLIDIHSKIEKTESKIESTPIIELSKKPCSESFNDNVKIHLHRNGADDDEKRLRSTSLENAHETVEPKLDLPSKKLPSSGATVVRSFSSLGDGAKNLIASNDGVRRRPSPRGRLPERAQTFIAGVRQSKFRHVTAPGKDVVYNNLRKINTRIPLESNGFCVSGRWAAIPLAGSGGVIAVLDLEKGGKLREGVIPGLENGANITDLQWCPFDQNVIAVACENGHINIWRVPEGGVHSIITEPNHVLQAHNDKICCLRYNPVASDVLASAANDCTVIVWDMSSFTARFRLSGHEQPVLSLAWNSSGNLLATVAKDSFLRVFDARGSERKEQNVLQSTKAARVMFVCNDRMLLVSSFSKSSDRMLTLYDAETLSPLQSKNVDVSSQPLIPYYDVDSSVVFLTGKGDRTIYMYEIADEIPYFMELSQHASATAHQAISFCPKYMCNVRKVEFAIGCRLTLTDLERLSFTVPRRRMECYQNDILPDSLVTWESNQTADQWFLGNRANLKYVSLKPDDMELLYKDLPESRPSRPKLTPKPEHHRETLRNEIEETVEPQPPRSGGSFKYSDQPSDAFFSVPAATRPILTLSNDEPSSLLRGAGDGCSNPHVSANGSSLHDIVEHSREYGTGDSPPPTKPARSKGRFIDADHPERRMFEISESMSKRMDLVDVKPLEQDKMEGVDDREWEML